MAGILNACRRGQWKNNKCQLTLTTSCLTNPALVQPSFEAPSAAVAVTEREGWAVTEALTEWEQKRQAGLARGIQVHQYIAAKIGSIGYFPHPAPRLPEMDGSDLWWADWSYSRRMPQRVVRGSELGEAGTVDAMLRDEQTGANVIFDWRTGQKFSSL